MNEYLESQQTSEQLPGAEYEVLSTSMPDDKLLAMLKDSLTRSIEHWDKFPYKLKETDEQALRYLLQAPPSANPLKPGDTTETFLPDNRLFVSLRTILSYATGKLAIPELTPSTDSLQARREARQMQLALYQHSLDEQVDVKVRAQVTNVITRKRGFLKLRFDPTRGPNGDIVTDNIPPEDIVIDRYAQFWQNPNAIHHRCRATIDQIVAKFPHQAKQIYAAFGIRQGRMSQISRMETYFETWFSYLDKDYIPREGVAWWLLDQNLILDKQPNPNWIYTGDDTQDKAANLTFAPPKPFVNINYLNFGKSWIDETCLFEQAIPQQELLNRRHKQWHKNIDYVNGRWIANGDVLDAGEATRMVNKGTRTIGLLKGPDLKNRPITDFFANVRTQPLGAEVYQSIIDSRNEIDTIMGTPAQLRGAAPSSQDTATRDLMVKQQAGNIQDDLVRAVSNGMETYYQIKLQLMRVYYNEDHSFQTKGGDGKYQFITLSSEQIDTNVKVGVQTDSTLPLDKAMIRQTAQDLLKANKIDYLTAMEDMGLPDPDIRTERYYKSQLDPATYLRSVSLALENAEAEQDIQDILSGKEPEERDNYETEYLDYYSKFMASNRFAKLEPDKQQALTAHLALVEHIATQQANLETATGLDQTLDAAGMLAPPMAPPMSPEQPGQPPQPGGKPSPQPSQPAPQPVP